MTASFESIWYKYPTVTIKREIWVKRLNVDGTYESSWQQVDPIYVPEKPVTGYDRSLSNQSWKFGGVTVGSCTFQILNPIDNFSDEEYASSIFSGYVRDRSLIRAVEYLFDPDNSVWSTGEIVFEGFIDADRTFRDEYIENVVCLDYISMAKDINMSQCFEGNVVTNGKFTVDANWDKGTSNPWAISGGNANSTVATTYYLNQILTVLSGLTYTIFYDVTSISSGSVTVKMGTTSDTARTSPGTYSFTRTTTSTQETLNVMPSGTNASISNIRVVRVLSLNDAIYELMNHTYFTKFFAVTSGTTYINASVNYSVDMSLYDGSVFDALEDMSQGMNMYYVDETTLKFYYMTPTPTASVLHSFPVANERKAKIYNMKEGTDRVYNAIYWQNEAEHAVDATATRIRQITLSVKGVYLAYDRQNILDYILIRQKIKRKYFNLDIPYAPFIKLLDRVSVQSFGKAPDSVARWGFVSWKQFVWGKAIGIKISDQLSWVVRNITHDGSLKSTLEIEIILS